MEFSYTTLINLVQQHKPELVVLYKKYGIGAEPSADSLIKAYAVAGLPFLVDLEEITNKDGDDFLGKMFSPEKRAERKEKRTKRKEERKQSKLSKKAERGQKIEQMKSFFDKGKNWLSGLQNAAGAVNSIVQNNTDEQQPSKQEIEAAEKKKTQLYFGIGGGVVVLLIIVFVLVSRKKSNT